MNQWYLHKTVLINNYISFLEIHLVQVNLQLHNWKKSQTILLSRVGMMAIQELTKHPTADYYNNVSDD